MSCLSDNQIQYTFTLLPIFETALSYFEKETEYFSAGNEKSKP